MKHFMKFKIFFRCFVVPLFLVLVCGVSYAGAYCELEGATTEDGEEVTGECYMYSKYYGSLEGAQTESGEPVSGECYRYSQDYAELEGAETEYGESVSGECYFY